MYIIYYSQITTNLAKLVPNTPQYVGLKQKNGIVQCVCKEIVLVQQLYEKECVIKLEYWSLTCPMVVGKYIQN